MDGRAGVVMTEHRSRELTGFTLFHHRGKGWQMSVRREGEREWDIKIIPDEQAATILGMLETSGHPDGPWTVKQIEVWASLDGPKLGDGIHASKYRGSWSETVARFEAIYNDPVEVAAFTSLTVDWEEAIKANTEARNESG